MEGKEIIIQVRVLVPKRYTPSEFIAEMMDTETDLNSLSTDCRYNVETDLDIEKVGVMLLEAKEITYEPHQ
jgi:hypothetical protein